MNWMFFWMVYAALCFGVWKKDIFAGNFLFALLAFIAQLFLMFFNN
jgi:hypothetical protein